MSGIKTQRVCPECGRPLDEFAAAWGWEACHECSVKDFWERKEINNRIIAQKGPAGKRL